MDTRAIGVVGLPFSGRTSLVQALEQRAAAVAFGPPEFRQALDGATSAHARHARQLVSEGRLIPADLVGRLMAEVIPRDVVVALDGFPRSAPELVAFEEAAGRPLPLLYLGADAALVDDRRRAAGLLPVDDAHPGAIVRCLHELASVLEHARRVSVVVEVDAARPTAEIIETVLQCFWPSDEAKGQTGSRNRRPTGHCT